MLPGWPRRLEVRLHPGAASYRRLNWCGRVISQERVVCDAVASGAGAVDALRQVLRDPQNTSTRLHVILSEHFVRYTVLPWHAKLQNETEWLAYARQHFTRTYGEVAAPWSLRVSGCTPGKMRVASAVDAALLQGIAQVCQEAHTPPHSIQPHFMHAFNIARSQFKGVNAWFALADENRLSLGLMINGEWRQLRSHWTRETLGVELQHFLEEEALLADAAVRDFPVYVHAPEHESLLFSGSTRWQLQSVHAVTPAHALL